MNRRHVVQLGDVIERTNERASDSRVELVLSVTEKRGIVPQSSVFNKRVAVEDLSKYKVMYPLDVAFNPYLVWAGAYSQWLGTQRGVVSPVYETFRVREGVDPRFVGILLSSGSLTPYFDATAVGSVPRRRRTTVPVFLSAQFGLPELGEQRRIVDLIGSIDSYIDSLQTQVEATRAASSAVLSDLLSNPSDDWQETSLKGVASIIAKRVDPTSLGDEIYVGLEHLVSNRRELSMWGSTSTVSSSTTPFFPGDTLFGRLRPYLQKGCVAPVAGFCSPEILVLRPATGIVPQFLGLLVLRDAVFGECSRLSAGSRMPRTSAKDLMGLSVLVPPFAEQRRIADLIGSFDEQAAALESQTASAQVIRSGVLSELLSGERLLDNSYDVAVKL